MVKISVIVPIYNCEDYLEESIKSILNQTFKDIEIICIDDGSADNSLNILKEIAIGDSRIKVYSQENQGSSIARNNALSKVSGDYVYFFDADDYLLENCLEKVYSNAVNNDSEIAIFYYDLYRGNKFLNHCRIDLHKKFPNEDYNNFTFDYTDYRQYAFKGASAPWFKLYKKEFLDKHDFIKFPPNLNHNDIPFHIMTILNASKISFLPEYLYHYRTDNPNSISNTCKKRNKDIFCILQVVEDYLRSAGLFDDLKQEFEFLKANHILYQMPGRNNEYFELAKEELSSVDLNNDYFTKNILFKANAVLDSNSIEEYNYKIKIHGLEKENKSLISKNKKLKGNLEKENESLIAQNKELREDLEKSKGLIDKNKELLEDLEKENESLIAQNKELLEDLEKYKNKNHEILNSNSWKITEPLRKLRRKF